MKFRFLSLLFLLACITSSAQDITEVKDLPLHTFPATYNKQILYLYFTGDGGWNNFSQQLVEQLRIDNHPVVAFDSRKYFWNAKTPEKFTTDVQHTIEYYCASWKLDRIVIVGYSFGADVAAFLPARLKLTKVNKIVSMVLLSPSYSTDFEVKLSDMISGSSKVERKYNVEAELLKSTVPVLCLFGEDEDLYLNEALTKSGKVKVKEIPGSHRYDNNVELIIKLILSTIK